MIQRLLAKAVLAVLMIAGTALAFPVPSAQAAYCATDGIAVLVDFGDLGGGESMGCGTGDKASEAFASAGYPLTPDSRQQGFVCQVQGKPADSDCMATDSYWAFFVSRSGGKWVYASLGLYAQSVSVGDSVALVWQSNSSRRTPGSAPWQRPSATPTTAPPESAALPATSAAPAPPTKRASGKATKRATGKARKKSTTASTTKASAADSTSPAPSTSAGSSSATATPTGVPSETAEASAGAPDTPASTAPSAPSPSAAVPESTDAEQDGAVDEDGNALPGWVATAVVLVLLLSVGGAALLRRRR